MKKVLKSFIYIIILLTTFLYGVGEAGAIFLLISPSPTMNGLGSSGVSLSTQDIYSSYYNPAQPQLPNGLSFQFSDMTTNWLPNLADDIILEYDVKMIGYNGFSILDRYLLQFSITTLNTQLDLGELIGMNAQGNPTSANMSAEAITYSLGLQSNQFPIYLGIGRTDKKAEQVLSNQVNGTLKNEFYDWGFRFSVDNYVPPSLPDIGFTYSLGYSKSNIGDPISFPDINQADPPPITARLGTTFGGNLTFYNDFGIELRFIREAEELMFERMPDSSATGYKDEYIDGLLNDIDIGSHIILGKADDDVIIHKGMEINLFNVYLIRLGKYIDEAGKIDELTVGFGINIGEMIIFASHLLDNSSLREMKMLRYINLQYNGSKYVNDSCAPLDNIAFNELTISLKNIDKLFHK